MKDDKFTYYFFMKNRAYEITYFLAYNVLLRLIIFDKQIIFYFIFL